MCHSNQKVNQGTGRVLPYVSLAVALLSLTVSGAVAYRTSLAPFAPRIWIYPVIQMQHKTNLGLYLDVTFRNGSPTAGLVSEMALILSRPGSEEDRYLLNFAGFRTRDEEGVYGVYGGSEDRLPLKLAPHQWTSKTLSFIYLSPDHFPISTGTFNCQLLVWVNYENRARYTETRRFEISAEVLERYTELRESGSTQLQSIEVVGAKKLESRKLSEGEYDLLLT
jgi:hypothetical protein